MGIYIKTPVLKVLNCAAREFNLPRLYLHNWTTKTIPFVLQARVLRYITTQIFLFLAHVHVRTDQLLVLQKYSLAENKTSIPRVQSIDEMEKLTGALRRMDAGKTVLENPNDYLSCVRTTNRCFHATHAYTGVPCAAYSEYTRARTSRYVHGSNSTI